MKPRRDETRLEIRRVSCVRKPGDSDEGGNPLLFFGRPGGPSRPWAPGPCGTPEELPTLLGSGIPRLAPGILKLCHGEVVQDERMFHVRVLFLSGTLPEYFSSADEAIAVMVFVPYNHYCRHRSVRGQVDFSHYSCAPADMAVALVNTDELEVRGEDHLVSLEDLHGFLKTWESLWDRDSRPPTEADVRRVARLRSRLRSVFESEDEAHAVEVLNTILVDNHAVPRVSLHGGDPHLHFEPSGDAFSVWLAVVTGMGLTTVLVDQGLARFGVCAAADCRDVFLDTSRNRSRRHCSTTCSTREAVAAHRRRRRETT